MVATDRGDFNIQPAIVGFHQQSRRPDNAPLLVTRITSPTASGGIASRTEPSGVLGAVQVGQKSGIIEDAFQLSVRIKSVRCDVHKFIVLHNISSRAYSNVGNPRDKAF